MEFHAQTPEASLDDTAALKTTPLHQLHVSLGARMVPFAGYDMPVQYPAGVMKEHLQTRAAAGLFDVSHMGQVVIKAKSGKYEDAALALESLVPVDILGLAEGRQRYGFFTDDNGGILDDLMITHLDDHLFVVVNAACKDADIAHLQKHIGEICDITVLDRALIALQGPRAVDVLAELWADVASMRFMDVRHCRLHDVSCLVSRSGYSGEDGYEISVPNEMAEDIAKRLLEHPDAQPIGLGARDSLRLEAGLCLYGNDIDTTTTPVEGSLNWAMQKIRRTGGARAGGFPGADKILAQLADPALLTRKRVGLVALERVPVRDHSELQSTEGSVIGEVSSGMLGPTINQPVAMGYVKPDFAALGTRVNAIVRGKAVPMEVAAMPFVPNRYHRG